MYRRPFYKFYWKLQPLLARGLNDSQQEYEEVLNQYCVGASKWLDLGCGHHLLPPWRYEQEKALIDRSKFIVGIDYDHRSLIKHRTIENRLRGNISKLPFPDNTFDLVTSNMVFEHLDAPAEQLKEIGRVLTKGGKLIFHTPNKHAYLTLMARVIPEFAKDRIVYFLQGREEEDVFPAFYRVNSIPEIRSLCNKAGFEVLEITRTCCSPQFVMIPPILVVELLWIRFLMSRAGMLFRPYLIAILEKAT
jgi:ubiquinone/menaquinone biosynthesis C-methylase UbiE